MPGWRPDWCRSKYEIRGGAILAVAVALQPGERIEPVGWERVKRLRLPPSAWYYVCRWQLARVRELGRPEAEGGVFWHSAWGSSSGPPAESE